MKKTTFYRGLFYILGLVTLALGLILNTKANLGVSPIISIAYSVSTIWNLNFGDMTLVLYTIFIVIELGLHKFVLHQDKKILILDVLQLPLSIVFTRFLNLFSEWIPDATGHLGKQSFVLILAIILTGIGAAMSLNMRVVPNPGDGIVQVIADSIKKSVGFTKNCFDVCCITTTTLISFLFAGHLIGIGVGTVAAVIFVGRVIAVFNHFLFVKMNQMAGIHEPS